jgi:hypothetical protein
MTIVEIRDDSGVLTSRLRIEDETFTLGRGPECSVVVDDAFVDAHHLTLKVLPDASGVSLLDAGSKNGTTVDGRRVHGEGTTVEFGTPVVVGQTTVCFRSVDEPVAEARALPTGDGPLIPYQRIPAWTTLGVAAGLFTLWSRFTMYATVGWAETVGVLMAIVGLFLLWAGFWAGLSRLFTGKGRFRTHLGFSALVALLVVPPSSVLGWLVFAADHPVVDFAINWVLLGIAMWTVSLYGHIDIASRRDRVFKLRIASIGAMAVVGVAWGFTRTEGSPVQQVQRSLLALAPVPDGMNRGGSLDDFLRELDGIVREHDEDVEQAERE